MAVAPAAVGSIPLQLVRAEPASGTGAMQGTTYIQRLNTQGGVAPAKPRAAAEEDEAYPVSLAQRAFPFIEMLEAAHAAGKDVTWGV